MNEKENNRFGIYVLLINAIISLFLLSSEGDKEPLIITTLVSNVVAIVFNLFVLFKSQKKIINILTLIINVMVISVVLILWYKKII